MDTQNRKDDLLKPDVEIDPYISEITSKMNFDVKFFAWYMIISGVLVSISIVGAIVGIPYIIAGIRLKDSAEHLNSFGKTNDTNALKNYLFLNSKFFKIMKYVIIASLIIAVLVIAFYAIILVSIVSNGMENIEF